MSDTSPEEENRPLLTRLKCRTLGHDWLHNRTQERRTCLRCKLMEEYSVDETHADEGAEKGSARYRIEHETLYIDRYTVTAWGDDTEHWQWFPESRGPAEEEHLEQLKQEIERYRKTEDNREETE